MDRAAGVDLADLALEHLGAVDGAARRGDARDEDLGAVRLERGLDAAPVRDLERRDGGAERDGVEAEEAVAEDDGVLWAGICWGSGRQCLSHARGMGECETWWVLMRGIKC